MPITTPVTLALPTEDRAAAHAFYGQGLGLETPGELADDGVPEPLRVVVNDGLHLMLVPTGGFGWTIGESRRVAPRGHLECQLTFAVQTDDEVRAFAEKARAAGAEVVCEPVDKGWGYVACVADPNGHQWMVVKDPAV